MAYPNALELCRSDLFTKEDELEYVFSLHSAIFKLALNDLANLLFILVGMSTVNMAEPNLYSEWGEFQSFLLSNLHKQQR